MRSRPTVAIAVSLSLIALAPLSLRADVRSDQKTKIEFAGMLGRMFNLFGGKSAREGTTSTVALKGNRKSTINDSMGQIIDLSEEKVYDLDMKKKTYKVTTFAELRRQMQEAQQKAQEEARKEEGKPAEKTEAAKPQEPQVEVDFDVKNTGQKKQLNGFDTHEAVMTITVREKGKTLEQGGGMVMTTDMWLAPSIKEMKEIVDFDIKYAQKLYGPVVQRHFGAADGDGSGDVSDDERRRREDEQRRREHRRHAHHDRDDDGRGEIGGAGGGRSEAVIHVNQFGAEDATAYQRRRTAWRLREARCRQEGCGQRREQRHVARHVHDLDDRSGQGCDQCLGG